MYSIVLTVCIMSASAVLCLMSHILVMVFANYILILHVVESSSDDYNS